MTTEPIVNADDANDEFERFLTAMDLHVPAEMDEDDQNGFKRARDIFVRAVQQGQLHVNGEGEPVFAPNDGGKEITFHEPTGADIMAMDRVKKNLEQKRSYAIIASMTGEALVRFSKMRNRDLKVCDTILTLFLQLR